MCVGLSRENLQTFQLRQHQSFTIPVDIRLLKPSYFSTSVSCSDCQLVFATFEFMPVVFIIVTTCCRPNQRNLRQPFTLLIREPYFSSASGRHRHVIAVSFRNFPFWIRITKIKTKLHSSSRPKGFNKWWVRIRRRIKVHLPQKDAAALATFPCTTALTCDS